MEVLKYLNITARTAQHNTQDALVSQAVYVFTVNTKYEYDLGRKYRAVPLNKATFCPALAIFIWHIVFLIHIHIVFVFIILLLYALNHL